MTMKTLPEPYGSIQTLPFDPHGWFFNEMQMAECLQKCSPKVAIEVGSWLGASTRFIGKRLPEQGKLYAVDTWEGSRNEKNQMQDPRISYLYEQFLSNVIHDKLTDVIVPVKMESLDAAKALDIQADLIYLDAAHDTESVYKDILAWLPRLKEGGVFCGDDWLMASVRKAVKKVGEEKDFSIHANANFWQLIFI